MNYATYRNEHQPARHGLGVYPSPGRAARLPDTDWLATPRRNSAIACETHVLHRWNTAADAGWTQLAFVPLDGNPRHGLLMLQQSGQADVGGSLEIIERQGRWLAMPGTVHPQAHAAKAAAARQWPTPWSSVAFTPDRRFMFFNLLGDQEATTFVMRRKDGGLVDAEHGWPR